MGRYSIHTGSNFSQHYRIDAASFKTAFEDAQKRNSNQKSSSDEGDAKGETQEKNSEETEETESKTDEKNNED